jgi:protoporphyrinogen/coproporphyrinogen III oxidase
VSPASGPLTVDVAIAGGGLAGLTLARDVHRRGRSVVVLEAGPRAGGVIRSERVDGVLVEAGPDAMLAQKPAAVALCRELGLGDEIVSTETPRTAFVLAGGRLHPLPSEARLGLPLTHEAIDQLTMLSAAGRARVARDFDAPAPPPADGADESIGAFTTRRFGEEFTRLVAQPLLGGIHAGDVDRLSLRALFPALADADAAGGSVLKTLAGRAGRPDAEGAFRGLRGGMGQLPAALLRALPAAAVRTGDAVARIVPGAPFHVTTASGLEVAARAMVLAVPAAAAARLLAPIDAALADACAGLRAVSTATITLAYAREAVSHPCAGMGFIVPRGEATRLLAVSWVTSKWAGRAPADRRVIRAFAGGAFDPHALDARDDALAQRAHDDLAPILGLGAAPLVARVYRWIEASPQYDVGHLARVAAIDGRLGATAGLYLTGAAYRGVGMPDVIADARATADRLCHWLDRGERG